MFDLGLPKSMWVLAVDTAVHTYEYNMTPHKIIVSSSVREIFTECKLPFQPTKEVSMHWFC